MTNHLPTRNRDRAAVTIELPDDLVKKWRRIVSLLGRLLDVPVCLVTQLKPSHLNILVASEGADNPFREGDRAELGTGHYCEEVIRTREPMLVRDALADPQWHDNPDLEFGLLYYMGYPIFWPDGSVFGTVCALDTEENQTALAQNDLLSEFSEVLTSDLKCLVDFSGLRRDEEERRYTLLEAANDAIFLMDEDHFAECNSKTLEIYGCTRDQIIGEHPWRFSPEQQDDGTNSIAKAEEKITRAYAGEPQRFEWRHCRYDRTLFDAEVSLNRVELSGKPFLIAIVRDVTERKAAEAAIREREERLLSIAESIPGVVFAYDRDADGHRTPIFIGPGHEEIIGEPLAASVRKNLDSYWDLIHPDDLANLREVTERGLETGEPIHSEKRVLTSTGEYTWVRTIARGRHLGNGVARWEGVLFDISASRDRDATLRSLFLAAPIGIALLSGRTIKRANDKMCAMIGYTREELIDQDVRMLYATQEEYDRAGDEKFRQISVQGTGTVETQLKRKDGSLIDVLVSSTPLDPRNLAAGVTSTVLDITERKRTEAERQEAFDEIARLKDALERERDYLREEVTVARRHGKIVGKSPALQRVLAQVEAVSSTDVTVLIQGESGVGKELIASAIHEQSPRHGNPHVRVNCASIPHELFESEFFGHVKGSFTGAHRDRTGRFQLADGGTLFLDELAEIPLDLQGKLLRVLQDGEFERVGEDITHKVDVRVVVATNRDLMKEVNEGRFREDLYYRVSVFPLYVPPLRERRQDIVPLARHFLHQACRDLDRGEIVISRSQADALERYAWPGNIRELQNVIERSVILSTNERLRLDPALASAAGDDPGDVFDAVDQGQRNRAFLTAAEFKRRERANLIAALQATGWRVAGKNGAADLLGLKPSTLSYQMNVMGIKRPNGE